MKHCPTCDTTKQDADFCRNEAKPDGLHYQCKACQNAYAKKRREELAAGKPPDWKKKTLDPDYHRKWREANAEKVAAYNKKHKRTPEQERAKYVAKMVRLHGPDWKPSKPGPAPYLTDEQRAESKKRKNRRNLERRKDDPVVHMKFMARKKAAAAVKSGRLVKIPCLICGSEDVEAHHPSYDLPLAVTWLCKDHHREIHAEAK